MVSQPAIFAKPPAAVKRCANIHTIIGCMVAIDASQSKLWRDNYAILMPDAPNKDQKSRLGFYIDWLSERGLTWYQPDLGAYRDYLLYQRSRRDRQGNSVPAVLSPPTVLAHLATIRGRYDAQFTRSNDAA